MPESAILQVVSLRGYKIVMDEVAIGHQFVAGGVMMMWVRTFKGNEVNKWEIFINILFI